MQVALAVLTLCYVVQTANTTEVLPGYLYGSIGIRW